MSSPFWFTVTTSQPDPSRVVLRAEGDLDLSGVERFDVAWRAALEAAADRLLVLELDALRFIDSTGLRGLLELREAAARAGARLVLRHPSAAVARILEIVGFEQLFEIDRPSAGDGRGG